MEPCCRGQPHCAGDPGNRCPFRICPPPADHYCRGVEEELQARVTLKLADGKRGPFGVPRWDVMSVGRTQGYALHIPNRWVPNKLCRFLPYDLGWVVQVGPRARMRVDDGGQVGSHVFDRGAVVALQQGRALLSFPELDDHCALGVVIGADAAAGLEELHDTFIDEHPRSPTAYAARAVVMTPKQRQVVATTFAYLLLGTKKPVNITASAAAALGQNEQAIKSALGKVRAKVNAERWGPDLESYEQLGHYLIHLTRNVTWDDLPEDLRRQG